MRSAVLPVVTFGLLAMVIADRVSNALASPSGGEAVVAPRETLPAPTVLAGRNPAPSSAPGTDSTERAAATNTPTIDRLARLSARRHLAREGGSTYLDSLIITTDSLVRRWPDRNGTPLVICVIEGGAPGYQPRMVEFIRDALNRWESTGMGVRFTSTSDSTNADIVVTTSTLIVPDRPI
jgi:hypothetical protein